MDNLLSLNRLMVFFLAVFMWSAALFAEKTNRILIVPSANEGPYQEAILGFKNQVSAHAQVNFTELSLSQAQSTGAKEINAQKPDVIYALGADAVTWAGKQSTTIPIVGTMVLKNDVLRQSGNNITGVSLTHPLRTQFQWLKKFFPQQKIVAILFSPAENNATIREAGQVSAQNGFKLVTMPVESPKGLPYALAQLEKNIDILMAIPDNIVMSVNTAQEVLLSSFRNKVPLIGLSDNWVKSGAFYALSWDYVDLGRQCADQAIKLLGGTPVHAIPPEHPRKVAHAINAKIAEHMDIKIPESLLKNAKMVFN